MKDEDHWDLRPGGDSFLRIPLLAPASWRGASWFSLEPEMVRVTPKIRNPK